MKKTVFATLLLFYSTAINAAEWEYMVVFLAGTVNGSKVVKQNSGAYLDKEKTETLNNLGKSGWELIAVTGDSGADHALYMKRKK